MPELQDAGRKDAPLTPSRYTFAFTAILTLAVDIVTKRMIVSSMQLHEVIQVVGNYVRITYILNPGAAFGLFPGSRVALIAVSVAAVVIVMFVGGKRKGKLSTVIPLGLILGGAIGNLIDRVRLGEVVDFVQVGIPPDTYWPVFNAADAAVTTGVVWLALGLVFHRGQAAEETSSPDRAEDEVAGVAASSEEV